MGSEARGRMGSQWMKTLLLEDSRLCNEWTECSELWSQLEGKVMGIIREKMRIRVGGGLGIERRVE